MALRAACSGLANTRKHTTSEHRCSVERCRAGKGRPCPHGTAKCANCRGPPGRGLMPTPTGGRLGGYVARGWKAPPPPRRERGPGEALDAPVQEAPAAQGGRGYGRGGGRGGGGVRVEPRCRGYGDGGVGVAGVSCIVWSFGFVCGVVAGLPFPLFGGHGGKKIR